MLQFLIKLMKISGRIKNDNNDRIYSLVLFILFCLNILTLGLDFVDLFITPLTIDEKHTSLMITIHNFVVSMNNMFKMCLNAYLSQAAKFIKFLM